MALLEIRNLSVEFQTHRGPFRAVDGIDLTIEKGELLGVVGESGSGKSVTMLAVMGLIPYPGKVFADKMSFEGKDLLGLSARARRKIIGKDIAMIFQEPMTSLNPCFNVGFQIMEALAAHEGGTRRQRRDRTVELLDDQVKATQRMRFELAKLSLEVRAPLRLPGVEWVRGRRVRVRSLCASRTFR